MMVTLDDYNSPDPNAWCPGCGNFGLQKAVKKALVALDISPRQLCMVSGIGQAAKMPHYLQGNFFNGLHGRTLPVATAIKLVNSALNVLAIGGDGDGYAEGGNHFLHALRRNPDITYIVHNNQVFALTKGQTSPTSDAGYKSGSTPWGQIAGTFNPLAMAVALDAGLVARGFTGEVDHLASLIQEGMRCEGFAFIDVLQPCISFNKVNTNKWYRDKVYKLDEKYDPSDRNSALAKVVEWDNGIPIGVLYRSSRLAYNKLVPALQHTPPPVDATIDPQLIAPLLNKYY